MHIRKLSLALSLASLLVIPGIAFAADIPVGNPCPVGGNFGGLCLSAGDLGTTIGAIVTLIFVLSGIAALIFLTWGGLKWVFSQGDKSQVEGARNQIVAALIGLIFVFLSYLFVNLMLQFFAGTNLQTLTIPQIPAPTISP